MQRIANRLCQNWQLLRSFQVCEQTRIKMFLHPSLSMFPHPCFPRKIGLGKSTPKSVQHGKKKKNGRNGIMFGQINCFMSITNIDSG